MNIKTNYKILAIIFIVVFLLVLVWINSVTNFSGMLKFLISLGLASFATGVYESINIFKTLYKEEQASKLQPNGFTEAQNKSLQLIDKYLTETPLEQIQKDIEAVGDGFEGPTVQEYFKGLGNYFMPNYKIPHNVPYRVGRKQNRAVLDKDGVEVVIFSFGQEKLAQEYCDFINQTYLE